MPVTQPGIYSTAAMRQKPSNLATPSSQSPISSGCGDIVMPTSQMREQRLWEAKELPLHQRTELELVALETTSFEHTSCAKSSSSFGAPAMSLALTLAWALTQPQSSPVRVSVPVFLMRSQVQGQTNASDRNRFQFRSVQVQTAVPA